MLFDIFETLVSYVDLQLKT